MVPVDKANFDWKSLFDDNKPTANGTLPEAERILRNLSFTSH